jgi:hypothetical protein
MKNLFKTEGAIKPTITMADLEKTFAEIEGKFNDNGVVVFEHCLERGIVSTTKIKAKLCNNENCKSCIGFEAALKEFEPFKQL